MGQPRVLFCSVSVFSIKHHSIWQQINVKNVHPVSGAWYSNSQPSDYESPPLITIPGLPPFDLCIVIIWSSPHPHSIFMFLFPSLSPTVIYYTTRSLIIRHPTSVTRFGEISPPLLQKFKRLGQILTGY